MPATQTQSTLFSRFIETYARPAALCKSAEHVRSQVQQIAQQFSPSGNVELRGSVQKGTAIEGSDIDLVICTPNDVTVNRSKREEFRQALEKHIGGVARSGEVAIQLTLLQVPTLQIDISFSNTTFGTGHIPPTPAVTKAFENNPHLRHVVQALKLLAKYHSNLPKMKGRYLENLVLCLHQRFNCNIALSMFLVVVKHVREIDSAHKINALLNWGVGVVWESGLVRVI